MERGEGKGGEGKGGERREGRRGEGTRGAKEGKEQARTLVVQHPLRLLVLLEKIKRF